MKSLIAVLLFVGVTLGTLSPAFGYRDLETGTFITRDPAGFVDGPNLYTYVRQNPWSAIDPTGLEFVLIGPVAASEMKPENPRLIQFYQSHAANPEYDVDAHTGEHSVSEWQNLPRTLDVTKNANGRYSDSRGRDITNKLADNEKRSIDIQLRGGEATIINSDYGSTVQMLKNQGDTRSLERIEKYGGYYKTLTPKELATLIANDSDFQKRTANNQGKSPAVYLTAC